MKLCPVLPYGEFESMFGNLKEAETAGFSVLDWYEKEGKDLIGRMQWDADMASELGLTCDTNSLTSMTLYDDALYNSVSDAWQEAAKKVIAKRLRSEFSFAGLGTMKVCLYSKDGYALKFGRDWNSLETEIRNNLAYGKYGCVPKMLAYDGVRWFSYVCEFARESVLGDFKELYGFDDERDFVEYVVNGDVKDPYLLGMRRMIKECRLSDLHGGNFGVAVRDGKKRLVLIDCDE